jgi:hypothetical protein
MLSLSFPHCKTHLFVSLRKIQEKPTNKALPVYMPHRLHQSFKACCHCHFRTIRPTFCKAHPLNVRKIQEKPTNKALPVYNLHAASITPIFQRSDRVIDDTGYRFTDLTNTLTYINKRINTSKKSANNCFLFFFFFSLV